MSKQRGRDLIKANNQQQKQKIKQLIFLHLYADQVNLT